MEKIKNIEYSIEFFSDWHCGSGLAAGADVDALVVKDKDNLPFVPGKTIKGLIREAVEDINQFTGNQIKPEIINKAFGFFDKKDQNERGYLFFGNAELDPNISEQIKKNNASQFLYRSIASTAIEDDGTVKKHSLRKIEVVVPCTVIGKIIPNESIIKPEDNYESVKEIIIKAFSYIKRIGQNRNRGLGRCKFTFINKED